MYLKIIRLRLAISALLLVSVFSIAQAQNALSFGKAYSISSKVLGEERKYSVWLPDDYSQEQTYPVLYVLDGNDYFFLASSAVQYFTRIGFMPSTIVVAIDNSEHRDRDLTPTKDQYSPTGGGAEKFHNFLASELIPKIDEDFSTNNYRTLYGASYGGLFALYELYNHTETFNAYHAVSPSVFHDGDLMFQQALKWIERPLNKNIFLFLSLANERFDQMRIQFHYLEELLIHKAPEKLRWVNKTYAYETHETTKMIGLNDALQTEHHSWFIPFYQRSRGVEGIKEHYSFLNDQYGYEIIPDEWSVIGVSRSLMFEDKKEEALECLKYAEKLFPNSPTNKYHLAKYFNQTKEKAKALSYIEKAIALRGDEIPKYYLDLKEEINKLD